MYENTTQSFTFIHLSFTVTCFRSKHKSLGSMRWFFSRVFFFRVRVVSARRDRQAPDMMWSVYFKDPYERWAGSKQATPIVVEQPMTWKLGVIKAHTGTYYEFLFSVVETVLLLFFCCCCCRVSKVNRASIQWLPKWYDVWVI